MARQPAVALACAAVGAASAFPAVSAAAQSRSPSHAQIRSAVAGAALSRSLWATVNVCNTRTQPDTLGVRAQMPALGFPARLSILIGVEYWDSARGRFEPVPDAAARHLIRLGVVSAGDEQGGESFQFAPHAGLLRATATFRWRRAGKLLLTVTRQSTAGHGDADGGDPPHYSAASCDIH